MKPKGEHHVMSDKILTSPEAKLEVQKLRRTPNQNLAELKQKLKQQLSGEKCLIVGSAPGASLPPLHEYSKCLCVNGSPYIANKHSIPVDLTVLVGFTTSMKKDISSLSMEKLSGIHSQELLFISAGDNIENGISELKSNGFTYDRISEINPLERAAIIGEICGEELGLGKRDDRISNGVFTIVLALWAGAEKVIISGFSLQGGHDYAKDTARYHLNGDTKCLGILARQYSNVTTTSNDLHLSTGLHVFQQGSKRGLDPLGLMQV